MASQARLTAQLDQWRPKKSFYGVRSIFEIFSHTSPPFASDACPGVRWQLKVLSRNPDDDDRCAHCLASTYQCLRCQECHLCLEFSLELEGGGEPEKLAPELIVFVKETTGRVIDSGKVSGLLQCKLGLLNGDLHESTISATVSFAPLLERPVELGTLVSKWCGRLLQDPKYADFLIRVGAERIPIHRALFAAASPVFARMFERDMEEKAQGYVIIEDFSAETMAGLRTFLYTGELAAVRGDLPTYLDLGEKFEIGELKDICVTELRASLKPANLCEWALLADKYGLEELFADCRRVIKGQGWGSATVPKEAWLKLTEDHKAVALNLLNPYYQP